MKGKGKGKGKGQRSDKNTTNVAPTMNLIYNVLNEEKHRLFIIFI